MTCKSNLIGQANQSLVSSSSQLAAAVNSFIQINLDSARTKPRVPPWLIIFPNPSSGINPGVLFPRGTDLNEAAATDLSALLKKDPLNIISCKVFDAAGTIQLSTDQNEIGLHGTTYLYYLTPFQSGLPYMSPVTVSTNGGRLSTSAHPSAPRPA